jgi:hypothetical protein
MRACSGELERERAAELDSERNCFVCHHDRILQMNDGSGARY